MSLDVLNPVSLKRLKGIGGFTYANDALIDNVNFWRASLVTDSQYGFVWTKKTNPPRSHNHFGMDIIGDNIYFMGGTGFFGPGKMYLTKYNITTDSYTTILDVNIGDGIPYGRYYMASGILNGYFYMFGGSKGSSWGGVTKESWRVNLNPGSEGEWERLRDTPWALANSGCFGNNSLFYIHCGGDMASPLSSEKTYNQTWSYNPATDAWTTLASYGPLMSQNEMIAFGSDIYSIGGTNERTGDFYANNEKFNTSSNTWSAAAPISLARMDHILSLMDGKIYMFGGDDGTSQLYDVTRYDPVTNTWVYVTNTPSADPPWYVQVGRAVTYGSDVYINSFGQMWKFSSSEIERFAVERIY